MTNDLYERVKQALRLLSPISVYNPSDNYKITGDQMDFLIRLIKEQQEKINFYNSITAEAAYEVKLEKGDEYDDFLRADEQSLINENTRKILNKTNKRTNKMTNVKYVTFQLIKNGKEINYEINSLTFYFEMLEPMIKELLEHICELEKTNKELNHKCELLEKLVRSKIKTIEFIKKERDEWMEKYIELSEGK